MGLHPSLKRAEKLGGERSVLKRSERIKRLIEEDKWKEGDSVLGLPKVKVVKMKAIKKEKPKEEETAESAEKTEDQSQEGTGKKKPAE
ncbi:MAG: small basic protein [Candidatus Omnitrophica bacterium]|nr:small basic protein [Candidatus Omnitrophota bacterium]MCF7876819.1 small basic protein [Candidatus Omnitrophota bacterium]MCF7878114.1 small basic protein [Candidatus Omnitrophota bacterium]MCF7892982.1 small basic protein [Candidatus Omnitrophota bacterium]